MPRFRNILIWYSIPSQGLPLFGYPSMDSFIDSIDMNEKRIHNLRQIPEIYRASALTAQKKRCFESIVAFPKHLRNSFQKSGTFLLPRYVSGVPQLNLLSWQRALFVAETTSPSIPILTSKINRVIFRQFPLQYCMMSLL